MNTAPIIYCSTSEEETLRFGRILGICLLSGTTVLLSGGLGAGKTVLVRGVGETLGAARVRSPSFTLVNEYQTDTFLLAHADLYRLEPNGVQDIDLENYLDDDCVLFVEWPERWKAPPENDVLKITIDVEDEVTRNFRIASAGGKAGRVIDALHTALGV